MLSLHDFPEALRSIQSWGAWKLLERVGNAGTPHIAKVMCDGLGRSFTLNDLKTRLYAFAPLMEAWNEARLAPECKGVAFRFEDEHNLLFVDLDGVRDAKTGELHPRAEAMVKAFPTWTEISQSGRGLHLIYKRSGPWRYATRAIREIKVETYSGRRFAALTGNRLPDTPSEANDIDATEFAAFAGFDKVSPARSGDIADLPPGLIPEAELVRVVSCIWPGIPRNDWISTLFALRHASGGSKEGLQVALNWSAGDYSERGTPPNHHPAADERAIAGIWQGGDQRRSGEARATAATLYKRAGIPMPPALANLFNPLIAPDFGDSDIATDWDDIATALSVPPPPTPTPEPCTPAQPVIDAERQQVADLIASTVRQLETTFAPWMHNDEDTKLALVNALFEQAFKVLVTVGGSDEAEGLAALLRAIGISALTLYGRTSPGMCRRVGIVRKAHDLGLEGIGNAFCVDGAGNRCPHAPECPLVRSWNAIPDVMTVIMLRQRITTPLGMLEAMAWRTAELSDRPIVALLDGKTVIDNLVEHDSIGAAELDIATRLGVGPAYRQVMQAAHAALAADPPPIHTAIRTRLGDKPSPLLAAARTEVQARNMLKVNPQMSDYDIEEAFSRRSLPGFFAKTVLLIEALTGNQGQMDVENGRIHLAARRKAELKPGRLGDRRIITHGRDDPVLHRRIGEWINQPINIPPMLLTPQVNDAPIIYQAVEREMTLNAWREGDSSSQRTLDLFLRILTLRYGRTGLVAHREVIDYVGWRPSAPFDSDFRLANVNALLIGGRFRPRLSRLYRQAACFDRTLPAFSCLPEDMPIVKPTQRTIIDRDGNEHHFTTHRSPLAVVAEETDLVEQTTQVATLDSAQFKGNRNDAVVIALSTAEAPGYAPDRVVTWDNLFGQSKRRQRLLALLLRLDGVVPLQPAMLTAFARDALPTRESVKRFLKSVESGPLAIDHPSWVYRRIAIVTTRSRGREGQKIEAITCLNDLDEAERILREQHAKWLADPEQKQFHADLAEWNRLID